MIGCTFNPADSVRHYDLYGCEGECGSPSQKIERECSIINECPLKMVRNNGIYLSTHEYDKLDVDTILNRSDIKMPIRCFESKGEEVKEVDCYPGR